MMVLSAVGYEPSARIPVPTSRNNGGMPDPGLPRLLEDPPLRSLDEYEDAGGGRAIAFLAEEGSDAVVSALERAGLRGRGGAGFPTAVKWRSILRQPGPRYVVCNAAEGEPGTFKDRALIRANPYAVIEGLAVAARAAEAREVFVALKESFTREAERITGAISEAERAGWLENLTVTMVAGPDEYLFGEEKGLLEVIEGKDPLPRWLPPYLHGLFAEAPQLGWQATGPSTGGGGSGANPTLVNNAETLAHVAWLLAHGADEFRSVGSEDSPGTIMCTVVGDVRSPGVVEVPMGTTLAEVLDRCGGPTPGRRVKAVVPGAAHSPLPADHLDVPLTYEDLEAIGSGLGAAGFTVYDDTACMAEVAATFSRFLYVESCGQCLPCKLGTEQITLALERIAAGDGTSADLDTVSDRLGVVTDGNRCYLPVQERNLVSGILGEFFDELRAHLDGPCPFDRREAPIPKIVDIADGVVTYDERQRRKRPDWTYE
jgi:NADH-quinone oxidoreductase subunit F